MALKCSLLGHRFEETEVEREREEQGSEVVISIKEFEVCDRCGETRVVSENKEVTTLETPDEPDADETAAPAETERRTDDADAGTVTGSAVGGPVDDAMTVDGAVEDEGVILDDGEDEDEDGAEDEAEAESTTIPDAEEKPRSGDELSASDIIGASDESSAPTSDDAGETTAASDDAVILDEDEPEPDPAQWPEEDEPETQTPEEAADWPDDDVDATPAASFDPADDAASVDMTVPEGMYKCSGCGFTTPVEESSLRPGDFCPSCHKGTLVQHEDDQQQ
ncbi:hypothetical protein VB773_00925 [Haloarculaceae archaeon H-GB2-1]|nr:hypothetical protein [Haloarculaceae archaeon H-GB1-1]MEA5406282.1 hypothetical protein [Haloarculaceae archaeon H-GB2-1]